MSVAMSVTSSKSESNISDSTLKKYNAIACVLHGLQGVVQLYAALAVSRVKDFSKDITTSWLAYDDETNELVSSLLGLGAIRDFTDGPHPRDPGNGSRVVIGSHHKTGAAFSFTTLWFLSNRTRSDLEFGIFSRPAETAQLALFFTSGVRTKKACQKRSGLHQPRHAPSNRFFTLYQLKPGLFISSVALL